MYATEQLPDDRIKREVQRSSLEPSCSLRQNEYNFAIRHRTLNDRLVKK